MTGRPHAPGAAPAGAADPVLFQDRRGRILEAAQRCFESRGLRATSMALIAREAGMSVGNLYNYFVNKEEIVLELGARELRAFAGLVAELSARPGGSMRRHIRDSVLRQLSAKRARTTIDFLAESLHNEKLRQVLVHVDGEWRRTLETLHRKRRPGASDAEIALRVEGHLAVMNGLILRMFVHPELDREGLADFLSEKLSSEEGDAPQ